MTAKEFIAELTELPDNARILVMREYEGIISYEEPDLYQVAENLRDDPSVPEYII